MIPLGRATLATRAATIATITPAIQTEQYRMLKQSIEQYLRRHIAGEIPAWVEVFIALFNILIILFLAWLVHRAARKLIRTLKLRIRASTADAEGQKRIETLGRVFGYIASVVISVVTVMLVLSEVGISIAPILATAGVAGIAIGFGAQSLVKDYFTGFVMLIEDQVRQGDVIEIAGKAGLVEEVTLRYVRLRDYEGAIHFVPNGAIGTVTNKSREFAFAVMDIGIAYREDVDRVFKVIFEVAESIRSDTAFSAKILEPIEISGVDQWTDSAVVIKARMKTLPLEQWSVRREYLRRLKQAFDMAGIEIPFPQRVVHTPQQAPRGPSPVGERGE